QQRGEGFELRTDMWGAIRAKKGIFISADGQERAQGQVREMAAAMGILSGAQSQMASLSADAETANADPADLESQVTLLEERVRELTQAVVLLSGPKGVTLASGEHMQLAAARSLEMNAGNNADIGVMKNLFIGVGQALSVFVRKAGIKLFANKGAISLQAQNDLMELLAKKSIEITSTEDEITITAKKKITINGGGSYIRLDPCGIEAGTQGEYNVKAGYYGRKPGAKIMPEMMAFPIIKETWDGIQIITTRQRNGDSSSVGLDFKIKSDNDLTLFRAKTSNIDGKSDVFSEEKFEKMDSLLIGKESDEWVSYSFEENLQGDEESL
ncbi:DUF2345 domain-containing protein, partial [Phytobacter diazotrophicus]|uniref:DUF2345 domain-containing protein n=2 Tax=Phytobacter diazotrophicus TaxID=395631 RepID=UPI003B52535F